jgi:phosphatidylglycerol:prolipoprotein diacylglycerol transferase
MLPYFPQPSLRVGPIDFHLFGFLVVMGAFVGLEIARRRAAQAGLERARIDAVFGWVLVFGFVGGHVFDELLYEPARALAHPLSLLRIWDGLGSFGGFAGAIVGATLFAWRRGFDGRALPYLDTIAYAFPFAWLLGRIGCAFAYDHPGAPTRWILGQRYVDGVVRHNLGLEEAMLTIALVALFSWLGRRPRAPGYFVGMLALLYAPVRFSLDMLRVGDARYFGATPAQYGAVVLGLIGAALLARTRVRPARPLTT